MASQGMRSFFPVRVDIPSLSGGVGRASPAKRVPTESEVMDNIICSLEHSGEKRQGAELLKWKTGPSSNVTGRLPELSHDPDDMGGPTRKLWFHWFNVSSDARYLISVDMACTVAVMAADATRKLLTIHRIDKNGELNPQTINEDWLTNEDNINYLTHNPDDKAAEDILRAVSVGSTVIILNKEVKAGFSSDENGDSHDMSGVTDTSLNDDTGYEVEYMTAYTVDPDGDAEIWTEFTQYIAGDTCFDPEDLLSDISNNPGTSYPSDYESLRKGIWKVKDQAPDIVGPDGFGTKVRRPLHGIALDQMNFEPTCNRENYITLTPWTGGGIAKPTSATVTMVVDGALLVDGTNQNVSDWLAAMGGGVTNWNAGTLRSAYQGSRIKTPHWLHSKEATTKFPRVVFDNTIAWNGDYNGKIGVIDMGSSSSSFIRPPGANAGGELILKAFGDAGYDHGTEDSGDLYWDSENPYDSPYEAEDNADGSAGNLTPGRLYLVIGVAGGLDTKQALVNHIVSTLQIGYEKGMHHVTSEVTAGLNGWEMQGVYTAQNWERDPVDEDSEANGNEATADEWARWTDFIKVADYFYPNPAKKFLGQAIAAFTDLKFPPDVSDLNAFNGEVNVKQMIRELYPEECEHQTDNDKGLGKIYYLSQQYLGLSEGYYRVRSVTEQPYIHKIRTPDLMGVIDKKRMPRQLTLEDFNADVDIIDNQWTIRELDWDPRDSGSIIANPGPSLFHDGDGKAVQRSISAMSFYRGRLFLASEDILVSSRINNWDNFWVDSSSTIGLSDPLDLRVSSNAYTPITYLQPYRSFLFLATEGSIQYELIGSENQISPLTAEIAPTSFYSMTQDVQPVLLNNNLFFLDDQKLYIYFGEQSDSPQNAMEISINCPEYIPKNFKSLTSSSVNNTLFIVDGDTLNHIYCYTNRVSGDSLAQNAFYRFVFPDSWSIQSVSAIDDYLYMVWQEEVSNDDEDTFTSTNVGRILIQNTDLKKPRMDSLLKYVNTDLLAAAVHTDGYTYCDVKSPTDDLDFAVFLDPTYEGDSTTLTTSVSASNTDGYVRLSLAGSHAASLNSTHGFYIGKRFNLSVELSPVFYRDDKMDAVNGTLNLRYGMFRFRNSGDFSVSVARKGREAKLTKHVIDIVGQRATLGYVPYAEFGVFKVPVLGFNNDLVIKLESDSVHPLSISDIEFACKFKYKMTSLGGM